MSVGKRIETAREKLGWTQTDLAARLGVCRQTIHLWEIDETAPKRSRMRQVAKLLGIDVRELTA